jgi:hypothetical protein
MRGGPRGSCAFQRSQGRGMSLMVRERHRKQRAPDNTSGPVQWLVASRIHDLVLVIALCAKINVRHLSQVNQPKHGSAQRDTSVMLLVKSAHGNGDHSAVRPWWNIQLKSGNHQFLPPYKTRGYSAAEKISQPASAETTRAQRANIHDKQLHVPTPICMKRPEIAPHR